jgi:ferric-dicitrate binding protein FerR (iron transport regulator)
LKDFSGMSADKQLTLAEEAAHWLVRLETADLAERQRFWTWLLESPLHVREVLAANACHIVLTNAFTHPLPVPHIPERARDLVP